jgi:hypothetical protein
MQEELLAWNSVQMDGFFDLLVDTLLHTSDATLVSPVTSSGPYAICSSTQLSTLASCSPTLFIRFSEGD